MGVTMEITDIIDPPVTPYSSPEEIKAWIKELETMERTEQVKKAIAQADIWLKNQND